MKVALRVKTAPPFLSLTHRMKRSMQFQFIPSITDLLFGLEAMKSQADRRPAVLEHWQSFSVLFFSALEGLLTPSTTLMALAASWTRFTSASLSPDFLVNALDTAIDNEDNCENIFGQGN
jgi:hypothetical protein